MTKMLEDLAEVVRLFDKLPKDGMRGWALGHNPPTSNMTDFDKYEVRELTFRTHHTTIADMAKRLEAAERDAARLKALEQAIEQWGNHPATKYKDSELWIRQRADALLREWTEGVG